MRIVLEKRVGQRSLVAATLWTTLRPALRTRHAEVRDLLLGVSPGTVASVSGVAPGSAS